MRFTCHSWIHSNQYNMHLVHWLISSPLHLHHSGPIIQHIVDVDCAELGINFSQIIQKMRTVLNPFNMNPNLHEDPDLSGPFLFCMLFGLAQLLAGKVHFGVILGWTSIASLLLYMIFNLLAGSNGNLDLYRCVSIVGYSLVPMVVFATLSVFLPSRYSSFLRSFACRSFW